MESTAVAGRSRFASSRVTNKPLGPLPGVDNRSTWGRRRRDLIASFTSELGRPLTERDRVLIANLSTVIVRTEQLHVAVARGEPVDDEQLCRLSHVAARLLTALSLDKGRPPESESLNPLEYARRHSEEREVD
jgi:hypothetical protein